LIIVGNAPFGFDPTLTPKAMKGWVEAAVLHLEQVVRPRPDSLPDTVAVLRSPLKGSQDEQVEGSLQQVEFP
jgi:hypothetical protein